MGAPEIVISYIKNKLKTDRSIESDMNVSSFLRRDERDVEEFIREFAREFDVNIESYLWYFHEDLDFFDVAFWGPKSAEGKKIKWIPITVAMLDECAQKKSWDISYPPHIPPSPSKAHFFYQIFAVFIVALSLVAMMHKFLS